jgi:hypothetical protein
MLDASFVRYVGSSILSHFHHIQDGKQLYENASRLIL